MICNSRLARNNARQAFAVMEYVMLCIILAAALYSFRYYIQRGFQGQYRRSGETFAFGRQYNPTASRDCAFDPAANSIWYETGCFNNEVIKRGCAGKAPGTAAGQYDDCIKQAKNACTAPCAFK